MIALGRAARRGNMISARLTVVVGDYWQRQCRLSICVEKSN